MTRTFIFSWSGRYENHPVQLDPVGLEDWNCPLTMLYWVAGHAVYGRASKLEEPRRSDFVNIEGPGLFKGQLHSRSFIIQDTLFMPDVEKKPTRRSKKAAYALGIEAAVPALGNAVYQEYVAVNLDDLGVQQQPAPVRYHWANQAAGLQQMNWVELERRLQPDLPEALPDGE